MTDQQSEILAVDIVRFERGDSSERRDIIERVRTSLATGFVYALHDIPEAEIDRAYEMLRRFFTLPTDAKKRAIAPGSMGQTGYTELLVETAATADVADWKEMLNWGLELPAAHPLRQRYPHRYMERVFAEDAVPGMTAALGQLWERLLDLQRRFLRIVALGIGCDERFFDRMLDDGPTLCRALRYPPMTEAPGTQHVWSAEHADINLITALPRATAPGLQVKVGEGSEAKWIDASPPDGHASLNTGMMLERITNGLIPSGIHRVVAQPGSNAERYSLVQFCHPSPWTILTPVSSCIHADRPQREAPILAADWLDQVLYEIGLSAARESD